MFHFNKKHLEDPTVPMWIIMAKGETYYVEHVSANIPWTTKETPDNVRTKGAIKFKDCLITIDDSNCADIRALTKADEIRIRNQERGIIRIITYTCGWLEKNLEGMRHGPIKMHSGGCGSRSWVTDLLEPEESSMFLLQNLSKNNQQFRVIKPNESFYKWYDDPNDVDYGEPDDLDEDEDFDD